MVVQFGMVQSTKLQFGKAKFVWNDDLNQETAAGRAQEAIKDRFELLAGDGDETVPELTEALQQAPDTLTISVRQTPKQLLPQTAFPEHKDQFQVVAHYQAGEEPREEVLGAAPSIKAQNGGNLPSFRNLYEFKHTRHSEMPHAVFMAHQIRRLSSPLDGMTEWVDKIVAGIKSPTIPEYAKKDWVKALVGRLNSDYNLN